MIKLRTIKTALCAVRIKHLNLMFHFPPKNACSDLVQTHSSRKKFQLGILPSQQEVKTLQIADHL
jgi:hypothetical protein